MSTQILLPKDIEDKLDDWFDGYSYEIIHYWKREETFMIVIVSTTNNIVCARVWRSVFSDDVHISIDKEFDLEN